MRFSSAACAATAILAALLFAGCAPEEQPVPVAASITGECSPVYGSELCSWGESTDGAITGFGITVPMDLVTNAPDDLPMVWPPVLGAMTRLPEAVATATGFSHLTFYWEPHGHPPGPYLTPHFDFHFYAISPEAREAMDCSDLTKPEVLPAGYQLPDVTIPDVGELPGLCVPTMGMHSLLATELASEALFEGTMVLGYYAGQSIFVEPMLTRELLLREQDFSYDWPDVPAKQAGARYPTRFHATYDSTARSYRFAFSGLGAASP